MNSEAEVPNSAPDLGARIKAAVARIGTQKAVGELIGVAQSTVGSWVSGKTEPSVSEAVEIARRSGVSLLWLMTGAGLMFETDEPEKDQRDQEVAGLHKIQIDETLLMKCLETAQSMLVHGNELRAARGEPPIEITLKGLASIGGNIYEQSFNAWVDDQLSASAPSERGVELRDVVALKK